MLVPSLLTLPHNPARLNTVKKIQMSLSTSDRFAHFPNPKHRLIGKLVSVPLLALQVVVCIALSIAIFAIAMSGYHEDPLKPFLQALVIIAGLWFGFFSVAFSIRDGLLHTFYETAPDTTS